VIKEYLGYFPGSNLEQPPVAACDDPTDRRDPALLSIVPDNARRAYDMKKVVAAIVDGGRLFEIKPGWAKNLITCLARLGGRPVGIVANQPLVLGGALDVDAADKAARFIMLCDAFHLPLVFLQDVPGFMVGSKVERQGIIRHGAKMLYAVSEATVPKVTVVVRKAYGAGYFVMCGKAYEPDLIVAWPTAEISVMGPEGGTNIIFRKEIAAASDPEAERARKIEEFRQLINPYIAAGGRSSTTSSIRGRRAPCSSAPSRWPPPRRSTARGRSTGSCRYEPAPRRGAPAPVRGPGGWPSRPSSAT
jgi:Acetyl-CoA carboxylase, carboxyltransferase component (subunits alpha and beta)